MHPIFYCQTPPWFSSQSVWSALTRADQEEFGRVRAELHQSQNSAQKDKRLVQFPLELASVLAFIDRSPHGVEARSIAAGASFAGPFIAVNTRHLKHFIGRCKSSINGCFQLIGYPTVRVKAKARECVLACLPSLANEPAALRQWTVRYAGDTALACFFSGYVDVGLTSRITLAEEDERRPAAAPVLPFDEEHEVFGAILPEVKQVAFAPVVPERRPAVVAPRAPEVKPARFAPKQLEFDLDDIELDHENVAIQEITPSFSVDYLAALEEAEVDDLTRYEMTRSRSIW